MVHGTLPSMACFASRFCGGYVVGPEWYSQIQKFEFLVQPLLCLKRACEKPAEIYLHKSLEDEKQHVRMLLSAVVQCGVAQMCWVARGKREELPRTQILPSLQTLKFQPPAHLTADIFLSFLTPACFM